MKNTTTGAEMSAQDKNIINLIKKQAGAFWVDRGYYPHYSHKLGKLSQGFTVERLKDGKPSTIAQATEENKENYIILLLKRGTQQSANARSRGMYFCYLSKCCLFLTKWDGGKCNPINWTTRGKKRADAFGCVYTCADAENLRKLADAFYLLKVAPQYTPQDEELQEQRRNNRPNPTTAERLKGAKPCQDEERTQEGARYELKTNGTRWGLTYSINYLDASGYDLTTTRQKLHHRARELKRARALKNWNNTDHAETVRELEQIAQTIKAQAVEIFASSGEFYPLEMSKSFRTAAQYVETTAEQIKSGNIESVEDITKRIAHSRRLSKKCEILKPLANDRHAYGWTWWELNESGDLVNTYENRNKGKYYDIITAQSVGKFETVGA